MRHLRLAATALALFAVAGTTFAGAATHTPAAPKNLRAFLLRPNEATTHVFSRTPAFAWSPVRAPAATSSSSGRARRSRELADLVERAVHRRTPHVLPDRARRSRSTRRCRGSRASRMRFTRMSARSPRTGRRSGARPLASTSAGQTIPKPMASQPGLIRWTPVEGATRYQVWYHGHRARRRDDEHQRGRRARVLHVPHRPVVDRRPSTGACAPCGRSSARSPTGCRRSRTAPGAPSTPRRTRPQRRHQWRSGWRSRTRSRLKKQSAHELMPGLTWDGTSIADRQYSLFRAYAFTDRDCVNVVFRGARGRWPRIRPAHRPAHSSCRRRTPTSRLALTSLPPARPQARARLRADGAKHHPRTRPRRRRPTAASSSTTTLVLSTSVRPRRRRRTDAGAKVDLPDLNFPTTRYLLDVWFPSC